MIKPQFFDDELFRALRAGDTDAVSSRLAANGRVFDFTNADFRGTDMRAIDPAAVVLTGAYLRDADLRGLDLRKSDLEGCSLHNAKIGGTYFPANLPAAEIALSVQYGTRLRTGGPVIA